MFQKRNKINWVQILSIPKCTYYLNLQNDISTHWNWKLDDAQKTLALNSKAPYYLLLGAAMRVVSCPSDDLILAEQ